MTMVRKKMFMSLPWGDERCDRVCLLRKLCGKQHARLSPTFSACLGLRQWIAFPNHRCERDQRLALFG
jgi:hypothetical protein